MRINTLASATIAMVAALSNVSAQAEGTERCLQEQSVMQQQQKSWEGTAECKIECKDGQCKTISATCSGGASYEDVQRSLRVSLEARAASENGKITGSITFNVKKKFN